ncbi:hypothetical protein [Parachlamydia sp. AcF125]|uniref:hypothetical protein n=1 Tax=Parachlamydia sp. AcF125 TaxID=2795736 RepID=UPI001BC97254|nr:hypothetical protein [Parachlamydia sp. AcF125]MBS4167540.1 hypothetical protein [Parachlamydia sp. AcF125]
MNIQPTINAIHTYTNNSKHAVLRLTKDAEGKEQLKAEKKNFLTRIKMFLRFKSYKFQNILSFIDNHKELLAQAKTSAQLSDLDLFYDQLGYKISHHNGKHPNHKLKISSAFKNTLFGRDPKDREEKVL